MKPIATPPGWVTNVGDVLAEQTTWEVPGALLADEPARRGWLDSVLEQTVSRFRGQHPGLEVKRYRVRYERMTIGAQGRYRVHVQLFIAARFADTPQDAQDQEGTDG